MLPVNLDAQVAAVREFNRFYTRKIGVLDEGYLASPFSLTESRVLYELAHRESPMASELSRDLGLDQGYLSRILARFSSLGLIVRTPSKADGRQSHIVLTVEGRLAFAPLDSASHEATAALLGRLAPADRESLVGAIGRIETLLGDNITAEPTCTLRPPRPGDLAWIVHRQAVLYAQEYGWNEEFEALAAEIVANFMKSYDAKSERCWLADRGGTIVGSVFLVRDDAETAKLRLLYVDQQTRGLGIGARLVGECIEQARAFGYRRLGLWTNDVLVSARRLYEAAGFRLAKEEAHHSFGKDLVGQHWELEL